MPAYLGWRDRYCNTVVTVVCRIGDVKCCHGELALFWFWLASHVGSNSPPKFVDPVHPIKSCSIMFNPFPANLHKMSFFFLRYTKKISKWPTDLSHQAAPPGGPPSSWPRDLKNSWGTEWWHVPRPSSRNLLGFGMLWDTPLTSSSSRTFYRHSLKIFHSPSHWLEVRNHPGSCIWHWILLPIQSFDLYWWVCRRGKRTSGGNVFNPKTGNLAMQKLDRKG